MKKLTIILTVLLLASCAFAARNSFRERSETWLQPGANNSLRAAPIINGDPTDDPTAPTPIGDSLLICLALGGMYVLKIKYQH
ncbi:MAG: hypothetical protein EZS26_000259 [Candidatus Ordinivivax streblomastigis]|uniref:Uncharacterized protein n=1 Tax=Candidatus Ordinivivax streblomastigis TaxID=2540710 RepID=A0A5M8P5U6_9BACT|nr:MAG: hypothetical protein EZS26_000259 [Candidatus Ordinivivax streblomastigis]